MLTQFYPPTIGGEEQHVRNLSVELAARGYDVAIATLWHEGLAEYELDRGVRVYRIQGTMQRAPWLFSETERRHVPPFPDPEIVWALRHLIAHERPEIIHAHNWLVHSFLPLKSWSKARLIVSLHDYSFRCAKKRFMYRRAPCTGHGFIKCLGCAADHYGLTKGATTMLSSWAISPLERAAVDMFLPVSQATAVGNGLVGSQLPFQVIPNFVPDDAEAPHGNIDRYIAQLPDENYILFVGDLSHDKGVQVLLRAYAELISPPPLVLIGRVCADTPAEFPSNVIVLSNWPHDAVMEAWRRCLLALVPSVWPEPFGMVAVEAMASGRAVIASRIGGLADIVVDGETGVLVSPGNPVELGQTIERLLADLDLRERMGQAGKCRVAEYRARAIVPQIEQLYRRVIAQA